MVGVPTHSLGGGWVDDDGGSGWRGLRFESLGFVWDNVDEEVERLKLSA